MLLGSRRVAGGSGRRQAQPGKDRRARAAGSSARGRGWRLWRLLAGHDGIAPGRGAKNSCHACACSGKRSPSCWPASAHPSASTKPKPKQRCTASASRIWSASTPSVRCLRRSLTRSISLWWRSRTTRSRAAGGWVPRVLDADKLDELLEKIGAQAARAGAVLQRLRAMLKKREPEATAIDLGELVSATVKLMEMGSRSPKLRVEIDIARDLPQVMADEIQIQQVVLNLVRNAIDAMETAGTARKVLAIAVRTLRRQRAAGASHRHRPRGRSRPMRNASSRPSTPPRGRAWASASRSAARSSKRMAGGCGTRPAQPAAPCSSSRCRPPLQEHDRLD